MFAFDSSHGLGFDERRCVCVCVCVCLGAPFFHLQFTLTPQAADTVLGFIRFPGKATSLRQLAVSFNQLLPLFLREIRSKNLVAKVNFLTVRFTAEMSAGCLVSVLTRFTLRLKGRL